MIATILNYELSLVEVYQIPKEFEKLEGDDIITNMGWKLDNISYMISEGSLGINIHTNKVFNSIILD